ncbi:MAG TPA: hypothetical protein DCQ29_00335 [Chitinophagaceae bacterium]|nr:hypothetical protein [Chitinophagaceae bacterium]
MRSKIFQEILDETPAEVEIFVRLYADLLVRIQQLLKDNKINQKELAARLDKKPSEISKWLNGEHNFTLRSLAKLSAELGEPLIEVPKRKERTRYIQSSAARVNMYVAHKNLTTQKPVRTIEWQQATDQNLIANVQ